MQIENVKYMGCMGTDRTMAHTGTSPDSDSTDTSESLFADCELGLDAILGKQTFSGRLYSPEKAAEVMNVNVRTGEPTHDIPPADAVAAWVDKKNLKDSFGPADRVALVAGSGEQLYESRSLLSLAAFYHMDVTSYDLHFAYNAAVRSDNYAVEYETDYKAGSIAITVNEVA